MRFWSEWAAAIVRAWLFPLVYATEQPAEELIEPRKPVVIRIIRNAARCTLCGDTVESAGRHDLRACTCQAMFVDGGLDYLRRGGNPEFIEDLSETVRE
jgi:hypothetical protein